MIELKKVFHTVTSYQLSRLPMMLSSSSSFFDIVVTRKQNSVSADFLNVLRHSVVIILVKCSYYVIGLHKGEQDIRISLISF